MKKTILRSAIAIALTSIFASSSVLAEQPKAEDLVGKAYAGLHLYHIETDEERLLTANPRSSINNGDGFGGELGYRLSTTTELRFGLTKINLDAKNGGFAKPDAKSLAIDVLYFPTEENFYLLGGFSELDIVDSRVSSNLGLGYRHYMSEKTAVYFETKAHYQFDEYYDDVSAQIGFTYFFGETKKTKPVAKPAPVAMLDSDNDGVYDAKDQCQNTATNVQVDSTGCAIAADLDTDKDGILDVNDQCNNSPMNEKVDASGCTVYITDKLEVNLLINFDNNSAVIKPEYFDKVNEVAAFLKSNDTTNVVIEGHASAPGNDAVNKKLSQLRADAVVDMLVNTHGIDSDRLSAIGYGEERLLNTANTKEANMQNRRIVAAINVNKKTAIQR